jgi:CheY-like chemotaxis protein
VQLVESGEEAIAYLSGQGRFADRAAHPFPLLVLLDLRMPGIGGFGVLRWLCAHSELKESLDIIALSAIQSSKEIDVVYELGAHYFWAKSDCAALKDQVCRVHESWIEDIEHMPDSGDSPFRTESEGSEAAMPQTR